MRGKKTSLTALAIAAQFFVANAAQAQYTVVPQGSFVRGHLWIGDGVAGVFSSNKSAANRLRFGGEVQFGEDYQFILGWTFLDRISSGETSTSVGDISRRSTDFNFGYFVEPDKLWLMYSLLLTDVSGSTVIGTVSPIGHQASVGYRFYSHGAFNLAVEGAYLFIPSYEASTYNYSSNVASGVKFPAANVWSVNLRIGFDVWGG